MCPDITWNGSSVSAQCGTATLKFDDSYSVKGCYPREDCLATYGAIPDSTLGDSYVLVCGSLKLFASASIAAGVAYFI